jgi:hypothetical protein
LKCRLALLACAYIAWIGAAQTSGLSDLPEPDPNNKAVFSKGNYLTDYGKYGGRVHWASAGVRPILHFNKYISLAFEGGVDWVKDEGAGTDERLLWPDIWRANGSLVVRRWHVTL